MALSFDVITNLHGYGRVDNLGSQMSMRFVLVCLLASPAMWASDTVLMNGHIYTGNSKNRWAEALAITGDKIDAVGSNADIARHRSANTKVIDLQGKTVIPGITDGHVHLWFGALALHGFNLSTPESNITSEGLGSAARQDQGLCRQPRQGPGDLRPSAVHHRFHRLPADSYKKPTVTHELLDRAVPDRPLVIHDASEHALWVNQKTLDLAHISDAPFPDPSIEANILRDSHGHRSGVVMEGAMEIVEQALPRSAAGSEV